MKLQACVFLLVLFLGIGILEGFFNTEVAAAAEEQQQKSKTIDMLDDVGPHLLKYAVLSLFLEIVLTLFFKAEQVFTWLQGKTWKTPVAIGFGLLAAWGLDLHISQPILDQLKITVSWAGKYKDAHTALMNVLDALLLAGGNNGLFRIFTGLGMHDPYKQMVRAAV